MMKNAEGKKMISGMVANVLEDITDVIPTCWLHRSCPGLGRDAPRRSIFIGLLY